MKARILISLLLVLVSTLSLSMDAAKVYVKCVPSVVDIQVSIDGGEFQHSGTGFVLNDHQFVTAKHVVDFDDILEPGAHTFVFRAVVGKIPVQITALHKSTGDTDIAILEAGKKLSTRSLPLAPGNPAIGSRVYVIGYPLDMGLVLSEGLVNQYPDRLILGVSGTIGISAGVLGGNSGGPVVDESGRVIGIVLGGIRGTHIQYISPVSHIRALVASMKAGD